MADIPNRIVLENANTDCGTLSQVISGAANTKVTSRLGRQYWTLATIDFKVNAVETLATQSIANINAKEADVESVRATSINNIHLKEANVEAVRVDAINNINQKSDDVADEFQQKFDELDIAISQVTADSVPATAVPTANTLTAQQNLDKIGTIWYSKAGGYSKNDRVQLENGKVVKSILNNNMTNPNTSLNISWVYVDYKDINVTINMRDFGVVGDYYLEDGTVNPNPTNNTSAVQRCFDFVRDNHIFGAQILVSGGVLVDHSSLQLNKNTVNTLFNIAIVGAGTGMRGYGTRKTLKDGFIFNTGSIDYAFKDGIRVDKVAGFISHQVFYTSTETVNNGEIPLNLIRGLTIPNGTSNCFSITQCNFYKLGIGAYVYGSGLCYINSNNFSLSNIGLWIQESGDNTISENYFNTMGWDVYDQDGVLRTKYTALKAASRLYGYGIWGGALSNTLISGGKMEWMLGGVDLQNGKGNVVSNINFDFNAIFDVNIYTDTLWHKASTQIIGNRFTSSGRFLNKNSFYNANLSGANITLWRVEGVLITGNTFIGGGRQYTREFEGVNKDYGPVRSFIHSIASSYSTIGNIFASDKTAITGATSFVEFVGNCGVRSVTQAEGLVLYSKLHNNTKSILMHTDNAYTLYNCAYFEVGDILYKPNNPVSGFVCTTSGNGQWNSYSGMTCTSLVNDTMIDGFLFEGGNKIIEVFGVTSAFREGCYVNINGEKRRISEIIRSRNEDLSPKYLCKLDSALSSAVTAAGISNAAAVFTEFGKKGVSVANATASDDTATKLNALLNSLRNSGVIST